jgi:hypothetical protein
MKKIFSVMLLVAVIGVSAIGCKSHEKCPAYSKVERGHKISI